ncbi:MAG: Hsp20/alpha crystallin family protein [Alphaproteobacteria bacterium]|nr:Hsp20/alpha crystallin family protein [Alphaproteobacteria bacterium]
MRSLIPFGWNTDVLRRGTAEDDPFLAMQKEVNRLFEDFGRGSVSRFAGAEVVPRIDVAETDSAIEVTAELPGIDEKDVDVVLRDDVLTIKGEKKSEREEKKKDYHLVERSYGSFQRSIRLPFEADGETVKASFVKGVLKISVAKPTEVKEKTVKIPVRGG